MRIREVRAARSAPSSIGLGEVSNPVRSKVVLAKPHGLIAQFFSENGLLPQVVQHIGGVGGFPS